MGTPERIANAQDSAKRSPPSSRTNSAKRLTLSFGGSAYDPNDPVGCPLLNSLGMVAQLGSTLIRARTHEGMTIAKTEGKLKGKRLKRLPTQRKHFEFGRYEG